MKKRLLTAMLVAMFMLVATFAWGQSIFYEEPFDTNQGWTLDYNWVVSSGMLKLMSSPVITNYDLSATSPNIVVPANAGDIVISQHIKEFHTQGDPPETYQIIAVSGDTPTVLWSYSANVDWGVLGGQNLTLSLAPFAGQTIQLKFRASGESTYYYNSWSIYGIEGYVNFNQDLAAISISGVPTPELGSEHPFVVTVRNIGLNTMNDYTVKLMQTGDVELGTVAGTSIIPGATIEYTIPWTPALLGETQLYGKVELVGDENPANNETNRLFVAVMEAGLLEIEIGTGTGTSASSHIPAPYGSDNKAFRQQLLYTADDFYAAGAVPGLVSALAFNVQDIVNCLPLINYTIRLKHTDQTALSSTFELGEYTTVWQRDSFMPHLGWNVHILDSSFLWDGSSNLIAEISTDLTTGFTLQSTLVYYSITSYESSLRFDSQYADGSTGTNGATSTKRSNIRFFMSPVSPDPQFLISYDTTDFGDVIMGYSSSRSFTMLNSGGGILTVSNISISGDEDFTITNLPVLPVQIVLGEPVVLDVEFAPTSGGDHTATITITDDLRLTHTVEISGHCLDHTIYELIYTEDFDDASMPDLPIDWHKIYEGADEFGYVQTGYGYPHTAPYCVIMGSSGDAAILIAPPLASTIPVENVRVKFWGHGYSSMKVGVMTDRDDADTFTAVETLMMVSGWNQYHVPLAGYTGSGKYIAFKLANSASFETLSIDTVEFDMMGESDLAAIALTGNSMPCVFSAAQYTVTVFNNGSAYQDSYVVKLFDGDGVELGATAGTSMIVPGATLDVAVSWTPTIQGPLSIYAKVFLAGDINPGNDSSSPMFIGVQPLAAIPVTIGDGSRVDRIPLDLYTGTSIYQSIYYAAEIGMLGNIHAITLYNDFVTTNVGSKPVKIWMGNTNLQNLFGGWIPSTAMTLVFDGLVNFPTGENSIVFPLQFPFTYTGGNLVVMFNRCLDSNHYQQNDLFKCQIGAYGRARIDYDNWDEFDPANLTGGYVCSEFPKTTFIMVQSGVGHITGTAREADGSLLADVQVSVEGSELSGVSNHQGQYNIYNIPAGGHAVSFSRYGYESQTQNIVLAEAETRLIDVTMNLTPRINITGHIRDHDTGNGILLANIRLFGSGWEQFSTTSHASGYFTIQNVIANDNYTYSSWAPGYRGTSGIMDVGTEDYNMGDIFLSQTANGPSYFKATMNSTLSAVNLSWNVMLQPEPAGNLSSSDFAKNLSPVFQGCRLWRLEPDQEHHEASWIALSDEIITALNYQDQDWGALPDGVYRWAAKAIYEDGLISAPSFSNLLVQGVGNGTILGYVSRDYGDPCAGATITAYTPEDEYVTTSDSAGMYSLIVPAGVYFVTAVFEDYPGGGSGSGGWAVLPNQNTIIGFSFQYPSNEDELAPVNVTALNGNYPNPFNPETTISYDLKDAASVRLKVYNIKGQLVRNLVHAEQAAGCYRIVFDGRDDRGKSLASGIYLYRLTAGRYSSTRKMILMQ